MNRTETERRISPRADLPCRMYIYVSPKDVISICSDNLSMGGVKLTLDRELSVGSVVNIETYLEEDPIFRKGKIVWVNAVKNDGSKNGFSYETGIEYCEGRDNMGNIAKLDN